jgi:diguanylate cyclase (GGDEF)-like protein/PAS domain S-box-containing protein
LEANGRGNLLARIVRRVGQTVPALFVLGLGLVISFGVWRFTEQRVSREAETKFQHEVAQAVGALDRRVQDNVNLLVGLRGLFVASDSVDRDDFQRYLSGFNLAQRYAGVRLVSFVRYVPHAQKAQFEEAVRRDRSIDPRGHPEFAIKPPGTRSDYLVVTYIEPLAGNERAFGFDVLSETGRRPAVERARDSGRPTASEPIWLAADPQKQISLALRMPVYRRGMPVATVTERRAAFLGVVSSAINAEDLVGGLLGRQLGRDFDLAIHDLGFSGADAPAAEPARDNLVFDSGRTFGRIAGDGSHGALRQLMTLDVAGRVWRLQFSAPAAPAHGAGGVLPQVVLAGGLVTSLLLFWVVWALLLSRERALKLAEHASAVRAAEGLREQLSFIQQLIEAVPQPIFFKDAAERRYLGVNRAWEKFFGIPRGEFIGKTVFELYPDNPELARMHHAKDEDLFSHPGSQSYEAAIVAADRRLHHTIYNKATFADANGVVAGLIGTITDVTGLKEAEAALREGEARFRDLTELSSDWYWEQDAALRFTQISSRVHEFALGSEEDIGKARWEFSRLHMTDEQWQPHKAALAARRSFQDFVYQRYDVYGNLRVISVSGRPIFDEAGRFQGYRGTGRDMTEQKRAEEQIRHMAHYDALTGLPNRMLLYDRIGQAIAQSQRNQEVLALLFIDLDRFKTVNDSLGHAVGDRLLKVVAGFFESCTRGSDTIARIGGDEFVVLLGGLKEPEDARHVAQKVLDALAEPVVVDGHELKVTPSVGICAYPHDGEDVETLMRNADTAMYYAKQMGRNNYQFFTQAMTEAAQQRLVMENDLRHAIERREFIVHYQPQLDLKSGAIIGFEALVRWRHPQRGMVSPAAFIAAAEETGLIGPLGEWVLREACTEARNWRDAGYPELQVSVNCSAQQFQREGFVETVDLILRGTGLPASCLELEITESVIVQHSEEVIARFAALDAMGVRISIDDFGTGYSSLSYLKRFAIHQLKIDQSFVRDISSDPDDAAIVSAIIAISHSLGLKVVAEGVETAEQLAFLRSLGCDGAQGYYFSRPVGADEFARLLESWNARVRTRVSATG